MDGRRELRMRSRFRCAKVAPCKTSTASALSTLLLHVPFRDPYVDILNRAKGAIGDATEEEVCAAVLRFEGTLRRAREHPALPPRYAQRIESVLANTRPLDRLQADGRELQSLFAGDGIAENTTGAGAADHQERQANASEYAPSGISAMLGCGADDGLLPPLPPPPPRPRPTGDRELDERALLDWCTATLNPEQRDVYNEVNAYLHRRREWMHQKREWQAKKRTFDELPHLAQDPGPAPAQPSAPRLFVTGPAGTGKSHVIEAIKLRVERWAREQGISGTAVLITATTGIAALNVNGITLHSALRLPLTGKFPGEKAMRSSAKSTRTWCCSLWMR